MLSPLVMATHLYTTTNRGGTGCNTVQVERFTFANERLTKQPDLRFPTMTDPIATDSKGNFYAQFCQPGTFFIGKIYEFPPGSKQPSRQLSIPGEGGVAGAMTVDAVGNVFVNFASASQSGIAVYPPGTVDPAFVFAPSSFPTAFTTDKYGALYSALGSTIDVWIHPSVNPPRRGRTLAAWTQYPPGLWIDSVDLYTCCTASSIVVYSNWAPVRVITPNGNTKFGGLAIAPNNLLYTIDNQTQIVGFAKWTSGAPTILDSVQLDGNATSVTVDL
jgi:hypothetical protein